MATVQGNLINHNGDKVAPNTLSSAVYDAAKQQALSATLVNTPDKSTLGYPAFSTLSDYAVDDVVYYLTKLWRFVSAHTRGDWNAAEVEEYTVKDSVDALQGGLESGSIVPAVAGNIQSWAQRDNLSVEEAFDDIVRTSGGDESIDSAAGCVVKSVVPKTDFYALAIRNTGKNLLRDAVAIGDGWYFLVPALPWGAYGTAQKPNGLLFVAADGSNLQPTVRFKKFSDGLPTSASDGSACAYTDSNSHRFYNTSEPGYIIVSGITRSQTCARIAWSTDYDQYVAVNDDADAGGTLSLSSVIAAVHDYNVLLVIGGVADRIDRYSASQVRWTRLNDRVQPSWTTQPGEEEGTYVHSASIPGMLPGGTAQCEGVSLSVDGTTVSYVDGNESATSAYVYYNLAAAVTGLVSLETGIGINDWGLTILQGAVGSAEITMQYAQGYPDAVAALLNGGLDEKLAEKEEEIEANTSRIVALESEAFGVDLSFIDAQTGLQLIKRSTANAYIVRKAGAYRIPLVYGNAIKDGLANPAAYTRVGTTYAADFVNHLGNAIAAPWIEDNAGCVAASAGLLWQTAQGMISDVSLTDGVDGRYLAFTLASVPETNGFAVLTVKDADGIVMWSWAVWVTTDDLSSQVLRNYTGVDYEMLGEPFGAVWNADRTRFVVPHYQWGRKDPMVHPSAYNSTTAMTVYDIDGNTFTQGTYGVADDSDAGGTVRSVANSIRMPDKFFLEYDATNYNWNNLARFNNFWNAAINASGDNADNQNTAIKTIYDPSPNNWMAPAARFATGFTSTGGNTSTASQFNVIDSFDAGWKFKRNATDVAGIYFPAAGYRRSASGALYNVGSNGYFWSFAPYSQTYARNLGFSSGNVYPLNGNSRAGGFALWAARELN